MAKNFNQIATTIPTGKTKTNVNEDGQKNHPPLESRLVEDDSSKGAIKKFPALNKRFACNFRCVQFFLPSLEALNSSDSTTCLEWADSMRIYLEDLKWLLKLPHYKFWSCIIFSKDISEQMLSSFLLRAPRPYDPNFQFFYNNDIVWPLYSEIYSYIFRIYMRLSVYKESPKDYITPSVWGSWIHDNYILDLPKLFDLCVLYDYEENEKNPLLVKMIENVFKYEPRFLEKLVSTLPLFLQKLSEPSELFSTKIQSMITSDHIDETIIQDLLTFQIDTIASVYKFTKHYTPAAHIFYESSSFLISLANSYESTVKLLGGVVVNLPHLQDQLSYYRSFLLLLYRIVITESTIFPSDPENTQCDLDGFFNCLTACLDDKTFVYDYTKAYPFDCDIKAVIQKGVLIDETRVSYVYNAINSCYTAFGEKFPEMNLKLNSIAKLKSSTQKEIDPLFDPHFDRQLLGACSVDLTGAEFESLVSQVKDLFSDLPVQYIEVCVKHYGYNTEDVINAILEGSVPSHLDKYKFEVPSPSSSSNPTASMLDEEVESETFRKGKWSHNITSDKEFLDSSVAKNDLKNKIMESLIKQDTNLEAGPSNSTTNKYDSYIDETFMPTYDDQVEYNDEFDDTYDDPNYGSAEPESWLYNPLNRKAEELEKNSETNNYNETEETESQPKTNFESFCEDPALIRERYDRRRMEKAQQKKKFVPPPTTRDVVGKSKGQGQEKDVLLNRRNKEANKSLAGNHNRKKGADWKRKEF